MNTLKLVEMKQKTNDLITVFKVVLPSFVVWPGKVTVNISYTRAAAEDFILYYPNRWMAYYMTIEEQEIMVLRETD